MNYLRMSMALLWLTCGSLLPSLHAQEQIEVGGMTLSWKYEGASLQFEITAPNDGWVALGFNHKNDIKDTHLLMFTYVNGRSLKNDLYVKAAGNPVPVGALYAEEAVISYACAESGKQTRVSFSIDTATYPAYSTSLKKGTTLWLICAYSEDDDFAHHSMMRKHVQVTL